MKNYCLGLLPLLLLVGSSCKKNTLPGFFTFDVQDTQTLVIPAGQFLMVGPIAMTSQAPAAYAAHGTDANYVQQVTPTGGTLTLTDPAGQTFDALTGATVYISATARGQDQFGVGFSAAVAAGALSLPLAPGPTPMDLFVSQPTYYLFVRLEPQQVLRQPTTLRVNLTYQVRARAKE